MRMKPKGRRYGCFFRKSVAHFFCYQLLVMVVVFLLITACHKEAAGNESGSSAGEESSVALIEDISVSRAHELIMNETNLIILDIRTPGEFAAGHLAGATNIDYYDSNFANALGTLDTKQAILVYCRAGTRSRNSLSSIENAGFMSIWHIEAGYSAWEAAGLPVEK